MLPHSTFLSPLPDDPLHSALAERSYPARMAYPKLTGLHRSDRRQSPHSLCSIWTLAAHWFAILGFLSPLAPYSRFRHLRLTRRPLVALPSQPKSGHTSAASLEPAVSASVLSSRLPRHHHHLACCISASLETPLVYLSLHLLALLLPLHSATTSPRGNNTFDRVYALFYIWAIGGVGIRVGTHTKTVC